MTRSHQIIPGARGRLLYSSCGFDIIRELAESGKKLKTESVGRVVCYHSNGAFLQLLSGHSILLRAYEYRPGCRAGAYDENRLHCEVREINEHFLLST